VLLILELFGFIDVVNLVQRLQTRQLLWRQQRLSSAHRVIRARTRHLGDRGFRN